MLIKQIKAINIFKINQGKNNQLNTVVIRPVKTSNQIAERRAGKVLKSGIYNQITKILNC